MEHTIILAEPVVDTAAMRTMVRTHLGEFIWFPFARPCWQCGEPCSWMEVNFETWLHPGRLTETVPGCYDTVIEGCEKAAWDEYWLATDS